MKILLLRQDRLGDLLISTSFLRNLREILPNAEIHILLGKSNHFAQGVIAKYIDKTWYYNKKIFGAYKLIYQLKKENFNYVIDLLDNSSRTSALFIKCIKSTNNIGFIKENKSLYNYQVELPDKLQFHIVERLANLLVFINNTLTSNHKITLEDLNLDLEYTFTKKPLTSPFYDKTKTNIFINLFGSKEDKSLGVKGNIHLIQSLVKNPNYHLMVSTTKKWEVFFNQIREGVGEKDNLFFLPFSDELDFTANLIRSSDLVISPDTAIVHLAACFKTPCIVFYPCEEKEYGGKYWLPYNTKNATLVSQDGQITSISVDTILNAIANILS